MIADSLRAHAAAGVTTVRDLGDRGYRTLAFRERPGLPRVVASGPPLTTPGGHCHFLGGAVDGDLRAAVAEHAERGVDVVKVMASGGFATPETDQLGAQFTVRRARPLVDEAHAAGLPVVAHAHSLVGMQNALAAGVDGIEHFSGLSSEGVQIDDDLLDEVARRGVYVDLTMGNDRAFHALMPAPPPPVAALMARFGRRQLRRVLRVADRSVQPGCASTASPCHGRGLRHGPAQAARQRLARRRRDGRGRLPRGRGAREPRRQLAAEACGLAGETGRLAEGYAADVLVVDGDLSWDVSLLSSPREVLIRGTRVDLA